MDQTPVVNVRQVDGGERLIRALMAHGFPLVSACWAKTPQYARPYLFLITGRVEGVDARPSYLQVRAALDDLESQWGHWLEKVGPFDVMLVAPSDPLAKALAGEYQHWEPSTGLVRTDWIGDVPLDGAAYVYPPELFSRLPATPTGS